MADTVTIPAFDVTSGITILSPESGEPVAVTRVAPYGCRGYMVTGHPYGLAGAVLADRTVQIILDRCETVEAW